MSETLRRVISLVAQGDLRISEHGYDELAADGLFAEDLLRGLLSATVVEDYPEYPKGPSVLVLQHDADAQPIHIVWGIPRGNDRPAVLVTAYRPDPDRWHQNFLKRRR